MKKILLSIFIGMLFLLPLAFLGAASYSNNSYQKLALEYTEKARVAFDEGEYDNAGLYSIEAERYAELSRAYIKMMLERADAEQLIKTAQGRLGWAEKIRGDKNFPVSFSSGKQSYENAVKAFEGEQYASAKLFAQQAIEILASIREITPLPEFYVVKPWVETKDCYWNISGRPYIYNNPLLWENLYQANKKNMKNPANPDLIYPGMIMKIPSITGEYREGTYSAQKKYDGYSPTK